MKALFKKQFFPESTIKSLSTNKTVFEKGKHLFETANITNHEVISKDQMIKFTVNNRGKVYTTQISFLKNGVARKYHCTCEAFKKYSGACKHVVGSMLYLNTVNLSEKAKHKQPEKTPKTASFASFQGANVLEKLKTSFSKYQVDHISYVGKERVNIEFIINCSGNFFRRHFELYLKVGLDHLYVIKNIPQIAKILVDGETHEFGKNFTYESEKHYIAPEDKRVLLLLLTIYSMMNKSSQQIQDVSYANKTELEIPNQYVSDLLYLLKETDGGYVRFARPPRLLSSIDQLESIEYTKNLSMFPIYFEVLKQGTRYYFEIKGIDFNQDTIFFVDESHLVEINHHFFGMSSNEYHIFKSVIDIFKESQYQPISFRNVEFIDFMSYIYPTLNHHYEIRLSDDIQKLLFNEPLQGELYIDYINQSLIIEPIFKYGELSIKPLSKDSSDNVSEKIMIRKHLKEQELMEQLHDHLPKVRFEDGKWKVNQLDDISEVIYESIGKLISDFDMYLTDAVKKLRYQADQKQMISVEVNEDSNLLEVDFELEDIEPDEIRDIIALLRSNKSRYYKLSSGAVVDLKEKQFELLNDVANNLMLEDKDLRSTVQVPLYQGLSLLENQNVAKSDRFVRLAKSLLEPKEINYDVPKQIQADLRPYQEVGYNWLKTLDAYQFGGVLADDMGLGKTLQSISFIQSKINEEQGKYLVVCPSSVLYNWQYEFNKFTEDIDPVIISGTIEERKDLIIGMKEADTGVWLTSYPLLQRDGIQYRDIYFNTVILDESQTVKNDLAKTTQAVSKLNSRNKFALSGTPIENNLDELWTLFSIIQPGMFRDKNSFKKMDTRVIANKIKPFILRRLKGQVLDDLPEKTETTEYIELSNEQKRLYQTQLAMIQREVKEYIDEDDLERNNMRILAGMTRLRQICCDPRLVTNNFDGESAKLNRLIEYLVEAKSNGKRVVLFSQFTKMLDIIRKELSKLEMDYHYLDGQTKKEDRLELTQRFNEGDKDLFLISLKAGGTGVNLTGGDTVILYDSWWNPAIEDQAADRVHRFGQKKAVQVLRLIARGTIEERINELQEKKRDLVDSVIETGNTKSISQLTKDELLNVLDMSEIS